MNIRKKSTFSRPGGDVGLDLGAVRERFSTDAVVIGDAVGKVFDLHPQGSTALHIYCHYLTDTWSARRGVCTGNTKTLDAAFYKRHTAKPCFHEPTHRGTLTTSQRQRVGRPDKTDWQNTRKLLPDMNSRKCLHPICQSHVKNAADCPESDGLKFYKWSDRKSSRKSPAQHLRSNVQPLRKKVR